MYRSHSIAVVVPSYNEERFVADVVASLPSYVDRVYAIDDASTDDTWAEIQRVADSENASMATAYADGGATDRVVPIRHETNRGVGGAIKTGYRQAREDGMDIAAVIAGDGQMDPAILERFLDPIVAGEADYTKGNRLLDVDSVEGMSRFRLFGNILLTLLTKIASGYWTVGDPQNGYTAVALDVFEDVDLEARYDEYGFANDLLVALNVHGKRVTDVRMAAEYGDQESTIRYGPFITNVSVLLLNDFLWRLNVRYLVREFHPLALLYYAGAVSSSLGVVAALALVAGVGGVVGVATALAGVGFLLFGVAFLLGAMVLDHRANVDLEAQVTD